eukprot:TRINITY_DN20872_c0_g1_i1.p1 TRINITY_DN20872_c0_g1~~TRINITY_DN20872_c0_g1_i1.p1  ORF type:complete len:685 (+),score=66.57 TRINITY_DN20872_c0_g1_i1:95-2149(+)
MHMNSVYAGLCLGLVSATVIFSLSFTIVLPYLPVFEFLCYIAAAATLSSFLFIVFACRVGRDALPCHIARDTVILTQSAVLMVASGILLANVYASWMVVWFGALSGLCILAASRLFQTTAPKPPALHGNRQRAQTDLLVPSRRMLALYLLGAIAFAAIIACPMAFREPDTMSACFVRVGAVDASSARMIVRIPPPDQMSSRVAHSAICGEVRVTCAAGPPPAGAGTVSCTNLEAASILTHPSPGAVSTSSVAYTADDCAVHITVERLNSSTDYMCDVVSSPPGSTLLLDGTVAPSTDRQCRRYVSFRTFPPEAPAAAPNLSAGDGGSVVRFAFSSCVWRWFSPLGGWAHVASYHPAFFLMLGDFVYLDHPPFLRTSSAAEIGARYRAAYVADAHAAAFHAAVPSFSMYDDHEVCDNHFCIPEPARLRYHAAQKGTWASGKGAATATTDDPATAYYHDSLTAWDRYVGGSNPSSLDEGERYYAFSHGDVRFFVLDTRRNRHTDAAGERLMLGAQQRARVAAWLRTYAEDVKFLVSGTAFSNLSRCDDSWFAHPVESAWLRAAVASAAARHVYFLSADAHFTQVYTFRHTNIPDTDDGSPEMPRAQPQTSPGTGEGIIAEFGVSPLDAFLMPMTPPWPPNNAHPDVLTRREARRSFGLVTVDTRGSARVHLDVVEEGSISWSKTFP